MTQLQMVVPVADGVALSISRDVDSFGARIGQLRVDVGAGQLVVRTGPEGAGQVDLLRVDVDPGDRTAAKP